MTPCFFGYGSLVNLATHDYLSPRPARLPGWRRVWRTTRLRRAAYLSAEPAPGVTIAGLVANIPGADWTALDAREAAYTRIDISDTIGVPDCAIYRVADLYLADAGAEAPILRSYLETVAQGFFDLHGARGVEDFFATTANWTAITDDRAAPLYPRYRPSTPKVTALLEQHLACLP